MRAYMAHDGEPHDCAILVFARTAREAKRLCYSTLVSFTDCEYTDIRVEWIRNDEHVQTLKREDKPHVIDDPDVCDQCMLWGNAPVEGGCEGCV